MSCIKCHKTIVLHNAATYGMGRGLWIDHYMSKNLTVFVYESNGYLFIREDNQKSYRN